MISIELKPRNPKFTFDKIGDKRRPVVTLEDHRVNIDFGANRQFYGFNQMSLVIPKGYRSDLTSWLGLLGWILLVAIPFAYLIPHSWGVLCLLGVAIFALILRDPFGQCQYAALVHDWCYEIKMPKPLADAVYLAVMKELRVAPWRMYCHYWGVRWFGGPAYWNWWQKKRKLRKEKKELAQIKKRNLSMIRKDKKK